MNHTKELIELAHQGNKEARDVLVMEIWGLSTALQNVLRAVDMIWRILRR